VENRPGAGGMTATAYGAHVAPDGYILTITSSGPMVVTPAIRRDMPYDPLKDFTHIGNIALTPQCLIVGASSPFKTVGDLVAAAKAKPGSINFATSGNGTVAHLATELFQKEAGVKLTHIPYKGASQGITDVIGGQVQVYVSSIPTLIGHIRNGKLRGLAVTSQKRVDDLPQVPTVAESGYKGFEAVTWFGVLGPANLPKDITARLNTEINKALKAPDLQKKLSDQGADVAGSTPEEFGKLVRDDIVRWGKVVKESGAKID
jgi:tripartite-type tricarboxylate transporter receptor subunit TctC